MATELRETISLFEETRLGLARMALGTATDLIRGFERATETSAHTLRVARVGVWLWSADGKELRCATVFDVRSGRHESGATLNLSSLRAYAAALESRRVVLASDAVNDPDTRELRDTYLVPNGISSLLDAPLYRGGEVIGVVCHEHVGPARTWTDRERDFAASVADMMAIMLEQATRMELEGALAEQRARAARVERTESLARMGAGLAHDFNNVLAGILLRAQAIGRLHPGDKALEDAVKDLVNEAQFGARLVRQLLAFAKKERPNRLELDLAEVVDHCRAHLTRAVDGRSELVFELERPSPIVHVDPTHVEQILVNLIVNARDASAKRVVVTVRTEGEDARLEVADDGRGMDAETREHAFDPFFTTKGDEGSGLGLASVQSLVQMNTGRIDVTSDPGSGTTFVIRLPRTR
ncbi:MAG: GAF domain-containing sensor histidine kinase [Polyangiaceae bacterium]